MPEFFSDILYPVARWLHIVCTTLIVGGTLFYELVLPISIEDLKREQQLYVFARARLVFKWVVWISVVGLLLSGATSIYRQWDQYQSAEFTYVTRWGLAHIVLGVVGMVVGLLLTIGRRPPEDPVRWMRLNLVILLVAIFLGSATRHFQIALRERNDANRGKVPPSVPGGPATQPSTTQPATQPVAQAG